MKIFLEPYETEAAIQVGTKRYLMRLDSGDRAYYDRSRMEHDLHANIAACVAEIAVAKLLNQYWGNHWWVASGHKLYESATNSMNQWLMSGMMLKFAEYENRETQ